MEDHVKTLYQVDVINETRETDTEEFWSLIQSDINDLYKESGATRNRFLVSIERLDGRINYRSSGQYVVKNDRGETFTVMVMVIK